MNKPTILISTSSFGKEDDTPLRILEEAGIAVELNPFGRKLSVKESIQLLKGKAGVIAGTETLNSEVFDAAPELKVVSRCGAGVDAVDIAAAEKRGIKVCNTPNVHIEAVAELTLAGILSWFRKIPWHDREMRSGKWNKRIGRNLMGATIGLVGLGKVSKRLVELLRPFKVNILAHDIYPDKSFAQDNAVEFVTLDDLCVHADVLSLHVPFSKNLRGLLGADHFKRLKKDVLIINTSRGGLIDESTLHEFLTSNPDSGAYLDTYEEEPYHGSLLALENVIFTPHTGTFTRETRVEMEVESARNLISSLQK